ncbi:hypothetical protein ABKA04_006159 [Annulohypoxylon sp. FPYF3050]
MLSSIGRAAIRRLISAPVTTSSNRIVVSGLSADSLRSGRLFIRGFATAGKPKTKSSATTKSAAKPAATKGRTKTTTKAKATAATKTTKAAASKSKSTKSRTTVKAKSKSKAKAKAKKPKARKRQPLSPEKKIILERRELKKAALFVVQKRLPDSPWTVFVSESTKGTTGGPDLLSARMGSLSQEYKTLPASRIQRLQATADQNKSTNAADYKAWVERHSPQQIRAANIARRALKKKHNYPPKSGVKLIVDERLPKQPTTPFTLFTKARWASGDLANKTVAESSKLLGAEWKNLSEAERSPYEELFKASSAQYAKEVEEVFQRKIQPSSLKAKSPA